MAHQLFCITDSKQYNITPIAGSISWKSSLDQLGVQLDFENAYNDDRYFPVNPINLGSKIILYGEEEIFTGIVVSEQRNGRGAIHYTAFDPAFYLNQSKAVYQFKGLAADQAITKILNDFGVPIGAIAVMPTLIAKICCGESPAKIIGDILTRVQDVSGIQYRMEMRAEKIYIQPQQDLMIAPTFSLASNVAPALCTNAISNPQRKRSIENMRNSVLITSNNLVIAEKTNNDLISRYGKLQEVKSLDQDKIGSAQIVAANLLKELAKIMEDDTLEMPGNDTVRAGRLLTVNEPVTGMSGSYRIKDVTHTIKGGVHTMSLHLEVV